MRVRVTNNGVSNTKYYTLSVRNELKASAVGYKLPDNRMYILNTSQGVYDKAQWKIGNFESTQLDSIILEEKDIPTPDASGKIGTMQVSSNDTDISSADILASNIEPVTASQSGAIVYQSFPKATNDVIKISDPSEVVKISLYGNTGTAFAIDSDMDMDGSGDNMDGITDNDVDNRDSASYKDGSVFTISDFGYAKTRERKVKITSFDGVTPKQTKIITLILDFIPETKAEDTTLKNVDATALTDFEKTKLEELAGMIRALDDADRIILMQKYNILAENWMNSFEKAKNLVDLQNLVNDRPGISNDAKNSFSTTIDALLMGDANTTNATTVASKLVKDLLPPNSANYQQMVEKIDAISSHPSDRETNKKLGEELLVLIQQEPNANLSDDYKLIIREQLKTIIANGDVTASDGSGTTTAKSTSKSSSSGIMGILGTI